MGLVSTPALSASQDATSPSPARTAGAASQGDAHTFHEVLAKEVPKAEAHVGERKAAKPEPKSPRVKRAVNKDARSKADHSKATSSSLAGAVPAHVLTDVARLSGTHARPKAGPPSESPARPDHVPGSARLTQVAHVAIPERTEPTPPSKLGRAHSSGAREATNVKGASPVRAGDPRVIPPEEVGEQSAQPQSGLTTSVMSAGRAKEDARSLSEVRGSRFESPKDEAHATAANGVGASQAPRPSRALRSMAASVITDSPRGDVREVAPHAHTASRGLTQTPRAATPISEVQRQDIRSEPNTESAAPHTHGSLAPVPAGTSGTPPLASSTAEVSTLVQSPTRTFDVGALAQAISRPIRAGDGSYSVSLALRPETLGQVQAVVSLRGSDVHVVLTPGTSVGHDAIASAVHVLKEELSSGGLNVSVTLQDPGSAPSGQRGNSNARGDVASAVTSPEPETSAAPTSPLVLGTNSINLVL